MPLFGNKKEKNLKWWLQLFTFIGIWAGGAVGIASAWLGSSPLWVFIVACIGMGLHLMLFIYDWIMNAYFPFSPYSPFYYVLNYKAIDSTPRDGVITWYSKFGLLALSALWTVVPLVNIILNIQDGNTHGAAFALAILQIILAAKNCIVLLFFNFVLLFDIFMFLTLGFFWLMVCWCPMGKCVPRPNMNSVKPTPLYLIYLAFFKVM